MDCPSDAGAISDLIGNDDDYDIVPINVTLTEIASKSLRELFNYEPGDVVLKIAVHSGGCSGNLYDMQIIDRPDPEGHQFDDVNGIDICVSDYDSSLLSGIVIDFQDSLMGGGFKINNPNADKACSCGKSFG